MGRRFVAQFAVVTGDTELLDQTQRRKQFRLAENHFRKNLFVKEVQVPRPEPNEISKENCRRDHDRNEDPKEILQDGLKHVLTSPFPWLTVNQIFPAKGRAS